MKTNKTVQTLVGKALRSSKLVAVNRQGEAVYEAETNANIFRLYHYGTQILEYGIPSKTIYSIGGYSSSDRDAINNALHVLGHSCTEQVRIRQGKLELITS
jgi:hypothetical protein